MPGIVAGSPVCSYWSWPPSCWVFLLVPQNWKTANRKYWETNMWLSKDQSKRQNWSPNTKTPVPTIWSTASSTFPAWNRILVNFYSQEMTFSSTWLSAVLFFVVFIDKPVSGISQNEKKCNVCVKSSLFWGSGLQCQNQANLLHWIRSWEQPLGFLGIIRSGRCKCVK